MSTRVPHLAAIIVTHNSIHVLGDLLDSLPAALGGLACDVVVVDNASTDGTADFATARDGCRVIRSANTGYAGGINRGVREATSAEAILVLNPDTCLAAGSVPPLLAALRQPGVGIAVPQIRSATGALELSLRREPTIPRALGLNWTGIAVFSERFTSASDYASPRTVDWATGAVMLMSRACFDNLHGWDESFFLYSEETDLCLRARDLGMTTRYEPASVVTHIGGGSGRNERTHAMMVINRVRLYRRRHRAITSWCYFWLAAASEFSWILRGRKESRYAVTALIAPSGRPPELSAGRQRMPT